MLQISPDAVAAGRRPERHGIPVLSHVGLGAARRASLESWPASSCEARPLSPKGPGPIFHGRVLFVSSDGARSSGIWQVTPCRLEGAYAHDEISVVLAGEMTIVPENGAAFKARPGDLLVFPRGFKCECHVHHVTRKLYIGRPLPTLASQRDEQARAASQDRALQTPAQYGAGHRELLDAAVRIVARSGIDGLTYRNIAAEAGLSRSLVSYYFPSPTEVIEQTLAHAARKATDRLDGASGPMSISALVDTLSPEADCISRPRLLSYAAAQRSGLRDAMRDLYRAALRVVRRALPTLSNEATARLVLAMVDGVTLQREALGEQNLPSDIPTRLEELLEAWAAVDAISSTGGVPSNGSDPLHR